MTALRRRQKRVGFDCVLPVYDRLRRALSHKPTHRTAPGHILGHFRGQPKEPWEGAGLPRHERLLVVPEGVQYSSIQLQYSTMCHTVCAQYTVQYTAAVYQGCCSIQLQYIQAAYNIQLQYT